MSRWSAHKRDVSRSTTTSIAPLPKVDALTDVDQNYRRLNDLFDRGVEGGVEIVVALAHVEPLEQGPGEAGDQGVVAGQDLDCLGPAEAAGQGENSEHSDVGHQVGVEVVLARQRQLQDNLGVGRERDEGLADRLLQ